MAAQHDRGPSEAASHRGFQRPLTEADRRLLEGVPPAIAKGADLERSLDEVERTEGFGDRFALATAGRRASRSFGFFAEAPVDGVRTPIMGSVLEQLYDRPKPHEARTRAPEADQERGAWTRQQVRELVLRYLLRIGDLRPPEWQPVDEHPTPPIFLQPLSWLSPDDAESPTCGFEQVYYKLSGADEIGRFEGEARFRIADLRQLGPVYDWIVLKARVFDLEATLSPLGRNQLDEILPRAEHSYLVLTAQWVIDDLAPPADGEIGRFGFGCAFLPPAEGSLLAFGPGRLDAAFQTLCFQVAPDGEVRVRMAFVAQRPEKLVELSVDPVSWSLRLADKLSMGAASSVLGPVEQMWKQMPRPSGVDPVRSTLDLANALAGGLAARNLGVSKRQLHKRFLAAYFDQQHNLVTGSLMAWRQIPDWLDSGALPEWVRSGWST